MIYLEKYAERSVEQAGLKDIPRHHECASDLIEFFT